MATRTQGKIVMRRAAGPTGFGFKDESGKGVLTMPATIDRPIEEKAANAEYLVRAWNNHDALVDALREAVAALNAYGAPAALTQKLATTLREATN